MSAQEKKRTDIISLINELYQKNKVISEFSIIALGGFGRGDFAPFSDFDLLFLAPRPLTAAQSKAAGKIQARLWVEGYKISPSVRTMNETLTFMKEDIPFLTSLLDRRLIAGSAKTYKLFESSFKARLEETPARFFIKAKLAERDARHKKTGDTRHPLEPNIKESKGALRDIQTLFWLTDFLYGIKDAKGLTRQKILTGKEAQTLTAAHDFFQLIRRHLHEISGRAEDRLSFDLQPKVAERLGYKDQAPNLRAEKLMKDYFIAANAIGHLTRIVCSDLEAKHLAAGTAGTREIVIENAVEGFPVKNNRLTLGHGKDTAEIVRLFHVSQKTGLDIHADVFRKLSKNRKPAKAVLAGFLQILLYPKDTEKSLRRMNECGLLTTLIPPFKNIFAHMQYDMYHAYTADEHTLRAVGRLQALENGEEAENTTLATNLFAKINSRRALYVAMFLHDIAKGTGGKHSEKGAAIAKDLCPKLRLSAQETETVAFLVENHLLMTMTAFKRDLNDEKTIVDFAAAVQSPERLKLLTILTTADILAVGPDRWNSWKAGLLEELYQKTAASLAGTLPESTVLPFQYLKDGQEPFIRITPHAAQDMTEVVICTPDKKGLFATLSGAFAAAGASIVDAQIFTLKSGMALDVFRVQNAKGKTYDNIPYLQKMLAATLGGKKNLRAEIAEQQKSLPRKAGVFRVTPRVLVDNDASRECTLIEINAKDRTGLLYDITSTLSEEGLQISAAKVTTFGSRAVDVFYVKDRFGLKILHAEKLASIEKSLYLTLEKTA